MSTFNIPQKIKVGFNSRSDTYTGKLGYITYINQKGETAQVNSWDGWRDKKIQVMEFDNTPSRFVVNKGVQRYAGHFGSGRSMVRIYDTRDFEFEITVDNMIDLLMHSDVSKRDITEECVFAWSGSKVYLLPVNSQEYQEAVIHTQKQAVKFSLKDLKPGVVYELKKNKSTVTYIGHYHFFECPYGDKYKYLGKSHVFYGTEYPGSRTKSFHKFDGKDISHAVSEDVADDYSILVSQFLSSKNYKNKAIIVTKNDNGTNQFVKSYNSYGEYTAVDLYLNCGKIDFNLKVHVELKISDTNYHVTSRYDNRYYGHDTAETERELKSLLKNVTDMHVAKQIMFKAGYGQVEMFEVK